MSSPGQPLNLHLTHAWGGGIEVWSAGFAAADPFSRNLVLRSFGTSECYGLGLRLGDLTTGAELGSWVLADPVAEVRSEHAEYRVLLEALCAEHRVGHLYVSSLVGHTLEIFRLGLPCTRIYHDYFPFCPAIFITRDHVCDRCGPEELELCRGLSSGLRPKASPAYHVQLREDLFAAESAASIIHVAPSHGVPRNLRRLDGRYAGVRFEIVEHGIAHRPVDCFGGAPEGRRLRVGLLGKLQWHKGSEILRRNFDLWRSIVDLFLIGAGEEGAEYVSRWGARVIDSYGQEQLPALLERLRLDLLLLLPVVPETFCYTLSEAWCFGIPPTSRRLGALSERITHGVDGFLLGLEEDAVTDFLWRIDRDREPLREVARHLRNRRVRSVEEEVMDYYRLRGDVLEVVDRRLALCSPEPQREPAA
jgi:glycosyltransferase involved in cell wall biosynthesis